MKVEFYLNDKTDISVLLERLAISVTLNSMGIHTIYINDKKYNLQKIRSAYSRKGFKGVKRMTDGIIKQIFNSFNNRYRNNPRWNTNIANELQQELTERINHAMITKYNSALELKTWLIGDNKE